MFRPLAFKAMGQEHHEAGHPEPFAFARRDELVEHDLRAVGEVAELGFPEGERVGFGEGIPVFEAEDGVFGEHRIDDLVARLAFADGVQGVVAFLGILVHQRGVALRERAAGAVLPCEADGVAFEHEGPEGHGLGGGPVEALAGFEHLLLGVEKAFHGAVEREAVGRAAERVAHFRDRFGGDGGLAALVAFALLVEVAPPAIEPVGLVGLEGLAGFEFLVELGLEGGLHVLDFAFGDQPVAHQPFGVELERRLVGLDLLVHQRVREHGLVALVMAEPAVAE